VKGGEDSEKILAEGGGLKQLPSTQSGSNVVKVSRGRGGGLGETSEEKKNNNGDSAPKDFGNLGSSKRIRRKTKKGVGGKRLPTPPL